MAEARAGDAVCCGALAILRAWLRLDPLRLLDMFTLIGLGTGAAFSTAWSRRSVPVFPRAMHDAHGLVPPISRRPP